MWRSMRRCYFVWHTPAELLRRRKFIKYSRLSKCAFTTLHHNCYSEFLFTSLSLWPIRTLWAPLAKVNTFSIAHKHEVNGMIRAYTSIRQMEHSFFLLFCEKWPQVRCWMWYHQHSTHTLASVQVVYSVHMHLGCNAHSHSCCHMPL